MARDRGSTLFLTHWSDPRADGVDAKRLASRDDAFDIGNMVVARTVRSSVRRSEMTCLRKHPLILVVLVVLACVLVSARANAQGYDLIKAAAEGDLPRVEAQLTSGADPNQVDNSEIKGWTPLMAAARSGRTAIAEVLLKAGANPNSLNEYGGTALDVARANGGFQSAIAQLLQAVGGRGREDTKNDVNDKIDSGNTALMTPSATSAQSQVQTTTRWVRENGVDARNWRGRWKLRGKQFVQFSLKGRYLAPPDNAALGATPAIVVWCIPEKHGHTNGIFLDGYISMRGIIDSEFVSPPQPVTLSNNITDMWLRFDNGETGRFVLYNSPDHAFVYFFDDINDFVSGWPRFAHLLYGRGGYHEANSSPQTRWVTIGVQEYYKKPVINVVFYMPDVAEVAEACGIIKH